MLSVSATRKFYACKRNPSTVTTFCSVTKLYLLVNLWTAACQSPPSFTISRSLLKFMSIELVMLSNHLILCHPLLLLPSTFFSIKVFSSESAFCIRWLKYWSFSFSISPFNEYSKLISFRIDRFDLLAVQGTLKSLLQLHNWKHQFFGTQPSMWSSFHICTWLLENHCFGYMEFCQQDGVWFCYNFPSKEQASSNFMAAVTVLSDLGVQENLSPLPVFPLLFAMKY